MKKILFSLIISFALLVITGCKEKVDEHSFYGKVIESYSSYIIVEPNENEDERTSSDKFRIELKNDKTTYEVGDSVKITYEGFINESDSAQIGATKIEIVSNESKDESEDNMNDIKINLNINGTNYTATLEYNETTQELIKRLPLELDMKELNGNEKYYYFDSSLPSKSESIGKIQSGDLMLYGNDCLVLFYESFNSSYSYTRIGKLDNPTSLKDIVGDGNIKIVLTK